MSPSALILRSLALWVAVASPMLAQGEQAANYRLLERDVVEVVVFDEPELDTEQRIDVQGYVRLPLLGNFQIAGQDLRTAEEAIERAYVEQEYLRRPQVTIRVQEYAPREISVLGSVQDPGKILLPPEEQSVDIVDVIARAGDFTRVAKQDSVVVRRKNASGVLETLEVNVSNLILGRGQVKAFPVYPGDVVFVPEKLF